MHMCVKGIRAEIRGIKIANQNQSAGTLDL